MQQSEGREWKKKIYEGLFEETCGSMGSCHVEILSFFSLISFGHSLSSLSFFFTCYICSLLLLHARHLQEETKKKKFNRQRPPKPFLSGCSTPQHHSFSLFFFLARARPALRHRAARAPSSWDRVTAVKLEPPRAIEDAGEEKSEHQRVWFLPKASSVIDRIESSEISGNWARRSPRVVNSERDFRARSHSWVVYRFIALDSSFNFGFEIVFRDY